MAWQKNKKILFVFHYEREMLERSNFVSHGWTIYTFREWPGILTIRVCHGVEKNLVE